MSGRELKRRAEEELDDYYNDDYNNDDYYDDDDESWKEEKDIYTRLCGVRGEHWGWDEVFGPVNNKNNKNGSVPNEFIALYADGPFRESEIMEFTMEEVLSTLELHKKEIRANWVSVVDMDMDME
jgi:hypothetical protein